MADYIDEDVLAEFPAWYKQQTGEDIRLIYQVFDINEIMLTKIERGHEDFDVVCPSEYIIERMLKKDLLLPIDRNFGKTPDYLPNISPYIRRELNKTSQPGRTTTDYAVPYMWGTAGILYNRNFITPDEAGSWHCLWNPRNKGKILMKDSYRDAYGTAIIYAHARQLADSTVTVEQLMNDNSPEAIALAEKYLKALKPNISGWEADFGKEMMTKNKTWLNLTWSGDAVWAIEEARAVGVDLAYEVPREGGGYRGGPAYYIKNVLGNKPMAALFAVLISVTFGLIFNSVQVPHYNYVGDSILGYKSHMGAGSITSNVKSDKTLVVVKDHDEKIETGLKKFGAMLGDYVEVGCNSVLNPGTVIGPFSNIYPVSRVRGYVPSHSIFKDKDNIVAKQ